MMDQTETLKSALAAFRESDFSLARDLCETLMKQNPDNPGALRILGQTCYMEGHVEEAAELLQKSLNKKPDQYSLWIMLGNVWADLGEHNKATKFYTKATEFSSKPDQAFLARAQSFNVLGEDKKAWADLDLAKKTNPFLGQTYRMMVLLEHPATKQPGWDQDLLQRLSNGMFPREEAIQVHYALAGFYGSTSFNKRMWENLNKANGLQKNLSRPWAEGYKAVLSRSREIFTTSLIENSSLKTKAAPTPVFIVGLPRSGSTLLEMMLSRHPDVVSAGETTALTKTIGQLQSNMTLLPFPEGVEMVESNDLATLSAGYLETIKKIAGKKPFVTDKLLSNGMFAGFIKLILPGAKVIHMRRDPLDCAFSIYKNYFWEQQNPEFCSLKDIGEYARMMEDIITHWKATFPGFIHDVSYEKLVSETEDTLRQTLDFIGLSWDANCLDHRGPTKRAETLSTAQTAKPLYSTAIGQGKKFQQELAPFTTAFSAKVQVNP